MIERSVPSAALADAARALRGVAHAALDGGWLVLETPLAPECPAEGRSEPALLAWNGMLAGAARFVLGAAPPVLRLAVAARYVVHPGPPGAKRS